MGIETFFTLQIGLPAAANAAAGKNLPATQNIQGLGFIDMILGQLLEQTQTAPLPEKAPLESDNPFLTKTTKLDITDLLAGTADTQDTAKNFITTPGTDSGAALTIEEQIAQILGLNQKAFDDVQKPLTDGTMAENIQTGSPRILQALLVDTEKDRKGVLNNLSLILDKLQQLTADPTGGGLAITNLTPEQITQLKAKIENLLANTDAVAETGMQDDAGAKDEDKQITDILLGLIKILPPQDRPEVIVLPRGLIITPRSLDVASKDNISKPANDLAAKLNDLVVGEDGAPLPAGTKLPGKEENFNELLKQFSGKKENGAFTLATDTGKTPQTPPPAVKPDLSVLQNWPFTSGGSLLAPFDSSAHEDGWSIAGFSLTGLSNMTSPLTQAPSASTPLPAVQMVAMAIQKAAGDGQNKNFTLQLEPPELGRIEVRLSFGKDKSVKAVVTAERSEAVTMLQRDSHVLERALQGAGLDMDSGSLSFELANDGHFEHDGEHDGSGTHGGNDEETAGDKAMIASTMTWYVDSATGHVRYDILA